MRSAVMLLIQRSHEGERGTKPVQLRLMVMKSTLTLSLVGSAISEL